MVTGVQTCALPISAPAAIDHDNGVSAQIGLDLAKLARLPISGNVGAAVNDKVTAIFQSVPQHAAVCQMLLQAISCASAMKNQSVAEAMTHQVSGKCPSEKPLNSPERAKILERIIILKSEIDIAARAIEEADPRQKQQENLGRPQRLLRNASQVPRKQLNYRQKPTS